MARLLPTAMLSMLGQAAAAPSQVSAPHPHAHQVVGQDRAAANATEEIAYLTKEMQRQRQHAIGKMRTLTSTVDQLSKDLAAAREALDAAKTSVDEEALDLVIAECQNTNPEIVHSLVRRLSPPSATGKDAPAGWRLHIYHQCGFNTRWNPDVFRQGEVARSQLVTRVRHLMLPNFGHEAHVYLAHVVASYATLSRVTVFLQGDFFNHAPGLVNPACYAHEAFDSGFDFAFFTPPGHVSDDPARCATRQVDMYVPRLAVRLGSTSCPPASDLHARRGDRSSDSFPVELQRLFQGFWPSFDLRSVSCPGLPGGDSFRSIGGASFAVHRRRIRAHPRELYERALAQLSPGTRAFDAWVDRLPLVDHPWIQGNDRPAGVPPVAPGTRIKGPCPGVYTMCDKEPFRVGALNDTRPRSTGHGAHRCEATRLQAIIWERGWQLLFGEDGCLSRLESGRLTPLTCQRGCGRPPDDLRLRLAAGWKAGVESSFAALRTPPRHNLDGVLECGGLDMASCHEAKEGGDGGGGGGG